MSPRKFRLIIPLVKGKNPEEAIAILTSVKKNASKYAIDLLKSAIANAKRKQGVDTSNLCISNMFADNGPMLKRFRAASMGRASMIHKHTSHLTVELDEMKGPAALPKDAKAKSGQATKPSGHAPKAEKAYSVKTLAKKTEKLGAAKKHKE
jgi:large subunit ribosomal protein L22